jgi:hypothetical protein
MTAADDLEEAVGCVVAALQPALDADWSVRAGVIEWSCRQTAEHIGQAQLHWASQLAVEAQTKYVRWSAQVQTLAPAAGVLEFVEAAGRILALVVRASPRSVRAFHPWGIGDPTGFAAMGCVEVLVHGQDLASGLGCTLEPSVELCEHVLARLFPHEPRGAADPWLNLRWLTGRATVAGTPSPESWRWRPTPLDETWDPAPVAAPMLFTPLSVPPE